MNWPRETETVKLTVLTKPKHLSQLSGSLTLAMTPPSIKKGTVRAPGPNTGMHPCQGGPPNKAAKQSNASTQPGSNTSINSLPTLTHTANGGHVLQPSVASYTSSTTPALNHGSHHAYNDPRLHTSFSATHTDKRPHTHANATVTTFNMPHAYTDMGNSDTVAHISPSLG